MFSVDSGLRMWVQELPRVFTILAISVSLSIQVYKQVPANMLMLEVNPAKGQGIHLQGQSSSKVVQNIGK